MSLPPPLPVHTPAAELAFVVQLQAQPPHPSAELTGRVEHIASGQATCFASLAELQAFMGQASRSSR